MFVDTSTLLGHHRSSLNCTWEIWIPCFCWCVYQHVQVQDVQVRLCVCWCSWVIRCLFLKGESRRELNIKTICYRNWSPELHMHDPFSFSLVPAVSWDIWGGSPMFSRGFYGENCELSDPLNATPDGRRMSSTTCNVTQVVSSMGVGRSRAWHCSALDTLRKPMKLEKE